MFNFSFHKLIDFSVNLQSCLGFFWHIWMQKRLIKVPIWNCLCFAAAEILIWTRCFLPFTTCHTKSLDKNYVSSLFSSCLSQRNVIIHPSLYGFEIMGGIHINYVLQSFLSNDPHFGKCITLEPERDWIYELRADNKFWN